VFDEKGAPASKYLFLFFSFPPKTKLPFHLASKEMLFKFATRLVHPTTRLPTQLPFFA